MKGVFARSPFQFEIRDLETPKPKAGEALIKVRACGVCGTDLHFAADWTEDWMPLGHEIAAEVVEVGPGVTNVKVGDKVIPEDVTMCGMCTHCKNGEPWKCRNMYDFGGQPGMAEYMALNEHMLNPFKNIDYVHASLTEPLAVAINTVKNADVPLGGDVVVYGPGPIGLMCVRLAKLQGAARVALIGWDRSPRETARMEVGQAFGADELIYAAEEDPVEKVRAIFPNGAPSVIVTSPPKTLPLAVQMAQFGGIISFIGINLGGESKVELDVNDLIFNKITLRSTFAEPGISFPRSIRLLEEGMIDAGRLITHTFSFPEVGDIMRKSSRAEEAIIKAVLIP
ncbi:MAG: zinc-dependent alcohol dehydrogenase family protein [Anaerolineae bacterium]